MTKDGEIIDITEKKGYNDIFDVLRSLVIVESPTIKDNITEDFTKAKLKEKDREFVVEMIENAYRIQHLFIKMARSAELMGFESTEVKEIKKFGDGQFKKMIIKITAMANINRNLPENPLFKLVGERLGTEMKESEREQERGFLGKIVSKLRGEE